MKDRINQILQREQLTPSRFAEILGVQPSSISHLLSGRNKPSFDFLEKVLLRFPSLSPDWVILGNGPMYRHESSGATPPGEQPTNLFPPPESGQHVVASMDVQQTPLTPEPKTSTREPASNDTRLPLPSTQGKSIERVIVFFTDKTFAEYTPE